MKLVILDGYTSNPGDMSWQQLEGMGELVVYDRTPEAEIDTRIADADIVLTNKTPMTRQTIEKAKQLKYIGVLATGYNIVDVAAASERDVIVTNVPSYSADSVAEFVFAFLLKLYHEISMHDQSVKAGDWTRCEDFCYWQSPLSELVGKTIGIIGYGQIGKRTAEIAKAFKMTVLIYHHRTPAGESRDGFRFVDLAQLYAQADIISLHIPLFAETEQMIDAAAIDQMKPGVIIVNTARGPLLDEGAVADALHSGQIGYLCSDVVSKEPIAADNPLLQAPHTVITPHIAWAPREARQRLIDVASDNVAAFIAGNPVHTVN